MSMKEEIAKRGIDVQPVPVASEGAPKAEKGAKNNKSEIFRKSGEAERAMLTEDQKAIEGTKSDKVAFVCALGDPNRKQSRVEKAENIPSYLVVGYKFKVLEDMQVPVAKLKENYKDFLDTDLITMRPVKAGEVVALNIVETAAFISRIEFAGRFTGEGVTVTLAAKTSDDRTEPLPILNKVGGGSVKENMELVANMVGATETSKGTPQLKEEFADMFEFLYKAKTITKDGSKSVSKKAGETQANIAAAFRKLYESKLA